MTTVVEKTLSSKLFHVTLVLLLNLGLSHVTSDLQPLFSYIFSFDFMKYVVVFAISYNATQDMYISLFFSIIIGLQITILLNTKSRHCIIPNNMQKNIESFQNSKRIKI